MSQLKEFEVGLGQMFEDGSPVVIAVDENNNPRLLGKEKVYLKSDVDKVIADLKTERDEYRYNLSCARNEIHNMQAPMREDIKTIAELKADYKEACDRLQTANLIKDEQKAKADKLFSVFKYLVMGDLIKDCPPKKIAAEIVKEYDNGLR